jgi:putative FmdB family regulatory protein
MPFYDYRCTKCSNEEHDVKRRITEDVSSYVCPKCHSEMKQIYSLFGFELKGDGWYETDYKRKPTKENGQKIDAKKKENTSID